jgi:methylated-DNA-[protein]-cysteine S-methyltransferase
VLDGGDVRYVVEDLASGRMLIATRPDGALLAALFAPDDTAAERALERLGRAVSPRVLRGGPGPSAVLGQLTEFLDGRRRAFELDLDPRLTTPFQWTVLQRLADQVGYGRTTSYGALATTIGRPTASRAVGAALGANPLCIVLPCHRVVAASGALTGYAGGLPVKRMLLDLESGSARLVS